MSRSGSGGAATLSSYRVQKAFSINFRENKRLLTEIKLIESEHIRNIRHVKQEIKDTRMWLENIRESTGKSQVGLGPDIEASQRTSRKKRQQARREATVPPTNEEVALAMSEFSADDDDDVTKHSEQEPIQKVRFYGKSNKNPRPWTDMATNNYSDHDPPREDVKSQPIVSLQSSKRNESVKPSENQSTEQIKDRVHSATSARSSLASITAYQRRHKLQTMMAKRQNPLEFKRLMSAKDNHRVQEKVDKYLDSLIDRMVISMPHLSDWGGVAGHHDTPFAQDVDITT